MANELNVTINELQTMSVHKIKECSKDPIFTSAVKGFQMYKPNDSRILQRKKSTLEWKVDVATRSV